MNEICASQESLQTIGYFMKPHHAVYKNAFHFLYSLRLYHDRKQRELIHEHVQEMIHTPNPSYELFGGIKDLIGENPTQRTQYEQGLWEATQTLHGLADDAKIHIRPDAKDPVCELAAYGNHCSPGIFEILTETGIAETLYRHLKRFGPVKRRKTNKMPLILIVTFGQIKEYWEDMETLEKIEEQMKGLRAYRNQPPSTI